VALPAVFLELCVRSDDRSGHQQGFERSRSCGTRLG
jgi:hypothetical protein